LAALDNSLKVMAIYIKEYLNKEELIIQIILNIRDLLIVTNRFILLIKTLELVVRRG
jgi:hypothetical protein